MIPTITSSVANNEAEAKRFVSALGLGLLIVDVHEASRAGAKSNQATIGAIVEKALSDTRHFICHHYDLYHADHYASALRLSLDVNEHGIATPRAWFEGDE